MCTSTLIWQFFRKSIALAPLPALAVKLSYFTVNEVLSEATSALASAVPAGQPDPLMVLMSRVILPEGGEESDGVAGAVTMARARPATANIPSIVLLQMGHSMFRRARQGS